MNTATPPDRKPLRRSGSTLIGALATAVALAAVVQVAAPASALALPRQETVEENLGGGGGDWEPGDGWEGDGGGWQGGDSGFDGYEGSGGGAPSDGPLGGESGTCGFEATTCEPEEPAIEEEAVCEMEPVQTTCGPTDTFVSRWELQALQEEENQCRFNRDLLLEDARAWADGGRTGTSTRLISQAATEYAECMQSVSRGRRSLGLPGSTYRTRSSAGAKARQRSKKKAARLTARTG